MEFKLLKSLLLTLVITLSFSTLVLADSSMKMESGVEKEVDGIGVELSFNDEKVLTGKNDIMITLHDEKNDQPITDAKVSATAEMDKNMSMDMKDSKPEAIEFKNEGSKGEYMGTVNFTDKGKWFIKATINVAGQDKHVEFEVDVESSGPNMAVIYGFAGIMALILVVAVVKKKQTAKA